MVAFQELIDNSPNYIPDAENLNQVRVIELIQEGGQAYVYKGQMSPNGAYIALKIFRDPDQATREARALEVLKNPRIPKLLGRFGHKGFLGLVIEYVVGQNYRGVAELEHSVAFFKVITRQLLEILAYIHSRHVYHNDISPDNILWSECKGCTLIDFGAASFGPLSSSLPFGRTSYLAPEILFGQRTSPQSDLYSLGATLFEGITKDTYCPDALEKSFSLLKSKLKADDESFFYLIKALLAPTPRLRPRAAQAILDTFTWEKLYDPLLVAPGKSVGRSEEDLLELMGASFHFIPTDSRFS